MGSVNIRCNYCHPALSLLRLILSEKQMNIRSIIKIGVVFHHNSQLYRTRSLVHANAKEADAANAITVPECEIYSLFIFCGDVMTMTNEMCLIMSGRGGECASMSVTGVPGVQTRKRRK
jgi:hypothetical protein